MSRWRRSVRIGTAALRLPLMAPISPGRTVLLTVLDTISANSGSGTRRSSADSGGARLGLSLERMMTYPTYSEASMMPGKNAPA